MSTPKKKPVKPKRNKDHWKNYRRRELLGGTNDRK